MADVYTGPVIGTGRHVLEWGPSDQSLEFDAPLGADILCDAVARVAEYAESWGRNAAGGLELHVDSSPLGWHIRATFGLASLAGMTPAEESKLEAQHEIRLAEWKEKCRQAKEASDSFWAMI